MENKIREKIITWSDPKEYRESIRSLSGLDYLKSMIHGEVREPPIANLIGYALTDAEHGKVAFEIQPEEYHYNPYGTVHGGIITTLLDSAMAASVFSMLPEDKGCSTVEIKVNFIRPITINTGVLRCEAKPVHVGNRLATAEGKLRDKSNKLYAHGVCTLAIFEI